MFLFNHFQSLDKHEVFIVSDESNQVCNYLFLSNKVDNSIIVWKARLLFSKSNRGS